MSERLIQSETLTDIADAIRAKTGGTGAITPLEMPNEIASIPSGGTDYLKLRLNNQTCSEYKSDEVTSLAAYCIYQWTGIQKLILPVCTYFYVNCCYGCSNLATVDIGTQGDTRTIRFLDGVFRNNGALKTVIIRNSTMANLQNAVAFNGTPFRNGTGGTLYVPAALITTYQNNSVWSALESCTITAIEGSEYE